MSSISKPNTFSASTTISSSEVNDNFDTIYNDYNGNISSANLADNAVTTAKITDSSVTTAKIADGAITPAKWSNPYKFSAYASGATSLASSSFTKLAFATEEYDSNNNFASNTYTAPVAGFYHFDATVAIDTTSRGSNEAFAITLYKNGSEFKRGNFFTEVSGSLNTSRVLSVDIQLAANDTVDIYAYNNAGGTRTTLAGQKYTYFNGHLLSV